MKLLAINLPGNYTVQGPTGVPQGGLNVFAEITRVMIQMIIIVILLWAFWQIIRGGQNMIWSQGDKQKINDARLRITYAIIGLIVAFLSFFFVSVFGHFVGIDSLLTL